MIHNNGAFPNGPGRTAGPHRAGDAGTEERDAMKHYHKLVRDGIPALIERGGHTPEVEILSPARYHDELEDKLQEELAEYLDSRDHVELMDTVEVIQAIVESEGGSWEAFERQRAARRRERGAFRERVWLKTVR
jgi:predicted house-cleaning noncanonical NTP pyrophosphatase (MazG superfamily)